MLAAVLAACKPCGTSAHACRPTWVHNQEGLPRRRGCQALLLDHAVHCFCLGATRVVRRSRHCGGRCPPVLPPAQHPPAGKAAQSIVWFSKPFASVAADAPYLQQQTCHQPLACWFLWPGKR